jgi:hypothetical protein
MPSVDNPALAPDSVRRVVTDSPRRAPARVVRIAAQNLLTLDPSSAAYLSA